MAPTTTTINSSSTFPSCLRGPQTEVIRERIEGKYDSAYHRSKTANEAKAIKAKKQAAAAAAAATIIAAAAAAQQAQVATNNITSPVEARQKGLSVDQFSPTELAQLVVHRQPGLLQLQIPEAMKGDTEALRGLFAAIVADRRLVQQQQQQ